MAEQFPQPIDSVPTPRFGAIATFMRLPHITDPAALDIALVGVPWDGGTTNRPGARHGPRQIRDLSKMMRRVHPTSLVAPFEIMCLMAECGNWGQTTFFQRQSRTLENRA